MRFLLIDDIVPAREFGYGYTRSFELLKELVASGIDVTLLPLQARHLRSELHRDLANVHIIQSWDPSWSIGTAWPTLSTQFDVIWVSRPKNMRVVAKLVSKLPSRDFIFVYDSEALHYRRSVAAMRIAQLTLTNASLRKLRDAEMGLMDVADVVTAVSESEKNEIESHTCRRTFVLSHSHQIRRRSNPFIQRRDLLFVGSFF